METRLTCNAGLHVSWQDEVTKVVQTVLEDEEYRTLLNLLRKKHLTVKEGLHIAVTKLLQEEFKLDSSDRFLSARPFGRSGRRDLSTAHDKYLYGKGLR
jgi:hypothetical protein